MVQFSSQFYNYSRMFPSRLIKNRTERHSLISITDFYT